jgi:two-component sensor histidine kinase
MSKDSTLMSGAFPFHLGILPGEPKPARAGVLYLEFDLRDKKADAFRESMGRIFLIAGIIAFLLFALGLYLDIVIARRLGRLTTMAEKFAAGDYQVRLGMKGRDEIAELGMALDRMAAEIQARNLRIEKDLKDKEVLIKELYHRTKNNMQVICSFLDLQSSEIDDPKFKSCVVEMKNRIHSMSLVHQMLYRSKDLVHVNMKDYLGELTRLLVSGPTHSGGKVTLSMEMEEIPALIDVAMPCGLIVNELVSNSLKHAFPGGRPGNIRVSLSRSPAGKILLKVEDDGVGFPEGFDYRSEGHLGLQTLLALGETQLRGKVSIESAAGLSCLLEFDDSGIRPKANGDKARPDIA